MKIPKKKSAKGQRKAPPVAPPLAIRLAEPEEQEMPYVERVHSEIQANLRNLHEVVLVSLADAEKCVAALVDAAMQATRILESIYGSGSEDQRQLVRKVALRGEKFVGIYEFRLPSALPDEPRAIETRGDEMRRAFTKEWQASAKLRATGKTEYDWLRLSIEGFVRAVYSTHAAHPVDKTAKASALLDWFLESRGLVTVPQNVCVELLLPEAQKDEGKWARAFVDWYESLHPWPFRDKQGDMTWPKSEAEIPDPIHKIAFRRLASLQASNANEKSPLNALRAVARERFASAFSVVKVKRDSDL